MSGALAVGLAFVSAASAIAGLLLLLPSAQAWGGRGGRRAFGLLVTLGTRLRPGQTGDLRARLAGAGAEADLRARLAAARDPAGFGVRELMAAKLGAALVARIAGTLVASVAPGRLGYAIVLAAPLAGFLAPDVWLARAAAERARRVRRELPPLLDLLRVTVEAGASLGEALRAVGERSEGPLAQELRAVGRQVRLGVPLAVALDGLVERVPLAEVRALVRALDRARRHGAPLADTLAAQARDARFALARRIREEAARAGPKIQLVVALLLVPSVLLLVAAALASALLDGGEGCCRCSLGRRSNRRRDAVIARIWRGAVRRDGDAYAEYMDETGVAGYRATPGNLGVTMLRRDVGDRCEFLMFTLWESLDAVKAFAGEDHETAVFYPEDDRFLVERDETSSHWEVAARVDGGG